MEGESGEGWGWRVNQVRGGMEGESGEGWGWRVSYLRSVLNTDIF